MYLDDKFEEDFYNYSLKVVVLFMIRAVSAFSSLEELTHTIEYDVSLSRKLLNEHKC